MPPFSKALCVFILVAIFATLSFATQQTIIVQNFSFTPANVTISHGDTIVWHCTGGFHNVHHRGTPALFDTVAANAPWFYRVVFDTLGDSTFHYECQIHPTLMQGTITVMPLAAPEPNASRPKSVELAQNYPNPFNPSTRIGYTLFRDSYVELTVFNILGQEVVTLFRGPQAAGSQQVMWYGKDNAGIPVESGMYLYRLNADGSSETKKMLLLK